jgi:hypothetical protein
VTSFNWAFYYDEADAQHALPVAGVALHLVVRTGTFDPLYTSSLASGLQIQVDRRAGGNATITYDGEPTQLNWITEPLNAFTDCIAGISCGDNATQATIHDLAFSGNTQDLATWGADGAMFHGSYIAGSAQHRPTVVLYSGYPTPNWLVQLGNPHLDDQGNPVSGELVAYIPPAYFDAIGTSADVVFANEVAVTSTDESGNEIAIPSTQELVDGGIYLSVTDIGFSMPDVRVYTPLTAAPGGLRIHRFDGALRATWRPPTRAKGQVTGYVVQRSGDGEVFTPAGQTEPSVHTFVLNGLTPSKHYVLRVAAVTTTGRGQWSTSRRVYPDSTAPTASMSRPSAAVTMSRHIKVAWGGRDEGSGLKTYQVQRRTAPAGKRMRSGWATWTGWVSSTSASDRLKTGVGACYRVRAQDNAGNVSTWSHGRCTTVPLDDRALKSSGFARRFDSAAWRGTISTAKVDGAILSLRSAYGHGLVLVVRKGPGCGSVRVTVDGRRVATVSLKAPSVQERQRVAIRSGAMNGAEIVVRAIGSQRVVVDGLAVLK